jgi:hypothetical protein
MGKRGPKKGAKNAGRPPLELDETLFIKYCKWGGTLQTIADYFDCDMDTVNAWCKRKYGKTFSEVYKKHSAGLKLTLRGAQIRTALGQEEKVEYLPDGTKVIHKGYPPNPMMQVWLGKNMLGQTDQPIDESKKEEYKPLPSMALDDEDKEAS